MKSHEVDAARVHDLLRVDPEAFDSRCGTVPPWVQETLAACPWVVVRREYAGVGQLAVGVRGAARHQRWGTFCAKEGVREIVRPEELLARYRSSVPLFRTPALRALREIDERWAGRMRSWGPGGSVGFELATGRPVTTETSDLDLILHAPRRITKEAALWLWERTFGLAVRVEVRIETPECACSLEEYAREWAARIVLRYTEGPRLGVDPWNANAEVAAS